MGYADSGLYFAQYLHKDVLEVDNFDSKHFNSYYTYSGTNGTNLTLYKNYNLI
jgi:hypothetical protein